MKKIETAFCICSVYPEKAGFQITIFPDALNYGKPANDGEGDDRGGHQAEDHRLRLEEEDDQGGHQAKDHRLNLNINLF